MLKNPSFIKTLHGVFLRIFEKGVLLKGVSGIGKSELGLALIARHHQLVADDVVEIVEENQVLYGKCPDNLAGILAIRSLGFLDISALYGTQAWTSSAPLDIIIQIDPPEILETVYNIGNQTYPVISLIRQPGRDLALWVEVIVKNHILKLSGYNSDNAFITRHQTQLMDT